VRTFCNNESCLNYYCYSFLWIILPWKMVNIEIDLLKFNKKFIYLLSTWRNIVELDHDNRQEIIIPILCTAQCIICWTQIGISIAKYNDFMIIIWPMFSNVKIKQLFFKSSSYLYLFLMIFSYSIKYTYLNYTDKTY